MNSLIATEADYVKALDRLSKLIDLEPEEGTSAADELLILAIVLDAYESKHFFADTAEQT